MSNDEFMKDVIRDGALPQMVRNLSSLEKYRREQEAWRPTNLWNPLLPPATVNANDDEFNDRSLSTNWTEFDPNNRMTVQELKYGLAITKVGIATPDLTGIYKTLPAGDFTMFTRCTVLGPSNGIYNYCGLTLWENPGDTTKKIASWGVQRYNSNSILTNCFEWTNYALVSSTKITFTPVNISDTFYFRFRRNGTNYYAEVSTDGIGWSSGNAYAALTFSFTPTAMGLHVNSYGVTSGEKFQFDFFRYLGSDVGFTGILEGDRM